MEKNSKTTLRVRNSITGQFARDGYNLKHPKTTEVERIPKPGYGIAGRKKKS